MKLQVYADYFRTVGLAFIMTIVFLCAFQQAASLAYSYWLSLWADDRPVNGTQMDHMLRLSVFGALGLTQGLDVSHVQECREEQSLRDFGNLAKMPLRQFGLDDAKDALVLGTGLDLPRRPFFVLFSSSGRLVERTPKKKTK